MIYNKKAWSFDTSETTYELSGNTITINRPKPPTGRFLVTTDTSIHMSSLPQTSGGSKHQIDLKNSGEMLRINNVHSDAIASFTARHAQYLAFIGAVMSAVQTLHPDSLVRIGPARIWYVLILLTLGVMFAGIVFFAFFGPLPITAFSFSTQIKFALVVLLQPVLIGWAIHARPRVIPISDAIAACYKGDI